MGEWLLICCYAAAFWNPCCTSIREWCWLSSMQKVGDIRWTTSCRTTLQDLRTQTLMCCCQGRVKANQDFFYILWLHFTRGKLAHFICHKRDKEGTDRDGLSTWTLQLNTFKTFGLVLSRVYSETIWDSRGDEGAHTPETDLTSCHSDLESWYCLLSSALRL